MAGNVTAGARVASGISQVQDRVLFRPSHASKQDMVDIDTDPNSQSVEAQDISMDTSDQPARASLRVPIETPVELRIHSEAYATMMASPDNLEDFAIGFALTEGLVASGAEIRSLSVTHEPAGTVVDIALHGAAYASLVRRGQLGSQRALVGRTGCGLCGVRTLDEARRALDPCLAGLAPNQAAIASALAGLSASPGLHAAALCDAGGTLLLVRQDVGRHNALDKLIGAMVRAKLAPSGDGSFCLITSRCSYEMVQKAVRAQFSTLVAISTPTALALETAQAANLRVVALARPDGARLFVDQAMGATGG